MNPLPRWIKATLVLALLVLVTGGAWFYHDEQRRIRRQVESELAAVAQLKVQQIAAWRQTLLDEGAELTERPLLGARLGRWLANPQAGGRTDLLAEFRVVMRYGDYADVLLVDRDGQVRFSLSGATTAHEGAAQALATAFHDRRPVLTDLHTEQDSTTPHLSVVAPLFSAEGQIQEPIGALILVSDARKFLYPLLQSWPTPSKTAETLLVRREGNDVLFLNDLRHQENTALKLRTPLSRTDVAAVQAVRGREGVIQGKDYRGVEVVATLRPIPDSPWFMVAKVDEAEAFAEWRVRSVLTLALLAGLALLGGTAGLVAWQRNQKSHFRALYHAEVARRAGEARFGITLRSIGDGVIATDAQGRIELLNPVAEALTGWTNEEARGKLLEEVFHIVNEQTRAPAENPVVRVLHEGLVVGLANHTLLIARDGTERPIADSAAPIRDEEGDVIGVVLVFRDQTEERAVRRERLLLTDTIRASMEEIYLFDADTLRFRFVNDGALRNLGYSLAAIRRLTPLDLKPEFTAESFQALVQPLRNGEKTLQVFETIHRRADGSHYPVEIRLQLFDHYGEKVFLATGQDITERKRTEAEKKQLQAQLLQVQKMESVGRLAGGVAHDFNNMLSVILGHTELALERVGSSGPLRGDLEVIRKAALSSADLTRRLLAFARKQTVAPQVLNLNDTVADTLKMLRRLVGENIDLAWVPGENLWPTEIDPAQVDQLLTNLCVNARNAIAGVGSITIETENVRFDEAYCALHAGFRPGMYVMLAVSDDGCGMEKGVLDHLFEPFFTTDPTGQNTGLGLATVYGIVKQNQGFINVYSEPGKGSTFKIYLPRSLKEAVKTIAAHPVQQTASPGETVLLVEDEPAILKLGRRILTGLGYTVLTAGTPGEALELAKEHSGEIHLLLTDVVMPEMNGRDLADRLRAVRPGMRCLFMSGYTANVIAHQGVLDEGVQFLEKPFSRDTLAAKVREALAH